MKFSKGVVFSRVYTLGIPGAKHGYIGHTRVDIWVY